MRLEIWHDSESVLTYLPVVSHTVVITPLVVKYFTYVNHIPLLSHPVYSTLNRLICDYTLIVVVLSYVFSYIVYLCQRLRFASCLINKQEVFEKCWAHSPLQAAARARRLF